MAQPQTPTSDNENPEYKVPLEDASTPTDGNSFIQVNTKNERSQTATKEFTSQEKTTDADPQTPGDNLNILEQIFASLKISDEREVVTHGSHVCKLPRTESSAVSDPLVSSLSDLPVYSSNTEIINTEQNVASNKNISQKEMAPLEKSDADVSKNKNVVSVEDMLAVLDTSRCLENKSNLKSSVEKLQNTSPLKQKALVGTELIQPTCSACQKTNSEHVVKGHDGRDLYICCRCSSPSDNFNYLQMHINDDHFKPYYCNACQLRYSQKGSHGQSPRLVCNFCDRNFACKYQLNEHFILLHKPFLETNCRVCSKTIDEHSSSKEVRVKQRVRVSTKYQCCVQECDVWTNSAICLNAHFYKHLPLKLFKCEVCGYHFEKISDLETHLQKIHPLCELCDKRFVNIYFFNEHSCKQHRVE